MIFEGLGVQMLPRHPVGFKTMVGVIYQLFGVEVTICLNRWSLFNESGLTELHSAWHSTHL